jgi:hypothetical protein
MKREKRKSGKYKRKLRKRKEKENMGSKRVK